MSWGRKQIRGQVYDLTHLDSFDMVVSHDQRVSYKVRVTFGAHTFTRKLLDTDTPDFHFRDGGQIRCFCPIRHSYSAHLPGFVRAASNGKAFFGNKSQTYLLIENVPGLNAPYLIAFTMGKARGAKVDATMFIVSAHDRPGLQQQKLPKIGLSTLVHLTMTDRPIKRPKK